MAFDPRITPARPDLAADHLRGTVTALRYAPGRRLTAIAPVSALTSERGERAELASQLLLGERFTAYETADGWAWGQAEDGYVGYVRADRLRAGMAAPTHRVAALHSPIYLDPDVRSRPAGGAPLGGRVVIVGEEGGFARMAGGGFLPLAHLAPVAEPAPDWVAVAEMFRGAPYIWGGRSPGGVDCSGLIQVALRAAGRDCPRDSDMQEAALGQPLPGGAELRRGDLVFWTGHVGVMLDGETLFHANAHHMIATSEPLAEARARFAATATGDVTSIRRLG